MRGQNECTIIKTSRTQRDKRLIVLESEFVDHFFVGLLKKLFTTKKIYSCFSFEDYWTSYGPGVKR